MATAASSQARNARGAAVGVITAMVFSAPRPVSNRMAIMRDRCLGGVEPARRSRPAAKDKGGREEARSSRALQARDDPVGQRAEGLDLLRCQQVDEVLAYGCHVSRRRGREPAD